MIDRVKSRLLSLFRYIYGSLCLLRPIESNKIVFMSYMGRQYSCNPKYISEYLIKHYPGKYKIIWAFNEPEKYNCLTENGIETVLTESKKNIDHIMTAKVVVTNWDMFEYLPSRKGQIVLNTWHGGGAYKKIGFDYKVNLKKKKREQRLKKLYSKCNLYISSSKLSSDAIIRTSRLYSGEILETGTPRNDIFFDKTRRDIKEKVNDYFGIKGDKGIILYAPTYRTDSEYDPGASIDWKNIINAAIHRFKKENWIVLLRYHSTAKKTGISNLATEYPDMQELLYAADLLITDYSSSIWDFAFTKRPAFLYCPDYEKYDCRRGFYTPIEEWPAAGFSQNERELVRIIENYDESSYMAKLENYWISTGNYETGHASERICNRIEKICFGTIEESGFVK